MMLTRRSFLAATSLAGGAALVGPFAWRQAMANEPSELKIPELIDARDHGQSISLKAQPGKTSFYPGRESETLGYNGSYLGPTLRVHRGDDVEVAVSNTLGEDTTVHWHGLLIPGELDGGPHQTIANGATWRPVLPIRQPAATLWYHSHAHGRTAEQVYAGLAGLMIVTDDEEKALGLPSEYGIDDIPLVLQDRQFEEGILAIPQGMMTMMHGRQGDTLVVNGTVNPFARVPRRRVRLRLLNGANARFFNLSFSDGRAFHWVASEGGLLESPVELRSLHLAPGERAEILVDFSDGRPATLETGQNASTAMMRMMSRTAGAEKEAVVRFAPQGAEASPVQIPDQLSSHAHLEASQAIRRRHFEMTMDMRQMMSGRSGSFGINGRSFDRGRIDQRIGLGDVEIWEVSSAMMVHPFHIHGVHFTVLSRNGSLPDVRDRGLRDTIVVQEPVELLVKFTQPAETLPFMYHCHILEHEDNGMMGQFSVS
ncbi:multicopper oxidase domain-containing protein [Modicisalibacter tunisiensis]|uniref:Multicopper oxidase CueO n=1 Tax=Modicisalibacter tunisiensis TaxID=390637 RepID=A0ABS7WWC5_9GAMM|nr:multicopper oxidase domain-containing protein [Modicisalibacter tunisiensis]MBZ9566469.1 multicopper oxidase domain-containing protein [Modicisalibacter tunisiensis]